MTKQQNMKIPVKNKHDDFLIDYLLEKKFLVSGELGAALTEKFGVSEVYARKIIERSVGKELIRSSMPMTFSKGQYAYFPIQEKMTLDTIKRIAKQYRPPLYRLIEGLLQNSGILSYYEAVKITGTPAKRSNSKAEYLADLLEVLRTNNFIYQAADSNNVNYILLISAQEMARNIETLI